MWNETINQFFINPYIMLETPTHVQLWCQTRALIFLETFQFYYFMKLLATPSYPVAPLFETILSTPTSDDYNTRQSTSLATSARVSLVATWSSRCRRVSWQWILFVATTRLCASVRRRWARIRREHSGTCVWRDRIVWQMFSMMHVTCCENENVLISK